MWTYADYKGFFGLFEGLTFAELQRSLMEGILTNLELFALADLHEQTRMVLHETEVLRPGDPAMLAEFMPISSIVSAIVCYSIDELRPVMLQLIRDQTQHFLSIHYLQILVSACLISLDVQSAGFLDCSWTFFSRLIPKLLRRPRISSLSLRSRDSCSESIRNCSFEHLTCSLRWTKKTFSEFIAPAAC
jgi:hypothetical protein